MACRIPRPVCQVRNPVCIDGGTLSLTLMSSPRPVGCNQEVFGPQTFGPAAPGIETLDRCFEYKNKQIEKQLLDAAETYYKGEDFRWFFTFAHGKITQQINLNLAAFQRPNALIRLNIHFSEEFLRAIAGQSHKGWRDVFRACQTLQKGSSLLFGEIEFCGAAMANVHIHIDLSNAIREIGCIPPVDYGNMLLFVNKGAKAAVVRLRGQVIGVAEDFVQGVFQPLVKLEVKAWRNAVYEGICNTPVPTVEKNFARRVKF